MAIQVVFFGTSEFAVPALEALVNAGYEISAVVTQPDRPAGRKQEPRPSPVKVAAERLGLPILQPTSPSSPPHEEGKEERSRADLFVVASYGQIIPAEILRLPKFGALNIHPSLLPKYRGPSPIHAAILNGDKETGVTIIKLDEEVDHGPIVANAKFKMQNAKLRYEELHDKLAKLGAKLLIQILPKYIAGEVEPRPQHHAAATFTKIITKADARIDWSRPAGEIDRVVRAYHLWPVAWATLDGKRLKVLSCSLLPWQGEDARRRGSPEPRRGSGVARAGEVETNNNGIVIHCGKGLLQIHELQLESARPLPARDFLNGYPSLNGKILT